MKLSKQRAEYIQKLSRTKLKGGFFYIISNPAFPDMYKIGLTRDLKTRMRTYQTCDPFRRFKVEHYVFCENVRDVEREVLEEFKINLIKGEWLNLQEKHVIMQFINNKLRLVGNSSVSSI